MPYSYPMPSLAGCIGSANGRPYEHVVWTWPDGMELQAALRNLYDGKCWCGKPSRNSQWWACSTDHTAVWWSQFERWGSVRREVIRRDKHTCRECGHVEKYRNGTLSYDWLEVDHIRAVSNGGAFWDRDNLRTLCSDCHKKKTAEDRRELSGRRKREKHKILSPLEAYA